MKLSDKHAVETPEGDEDINTEYVSVDDIETAEQFASMLEAKGLSQLAQIVRDIGQAEVNHDRNEAYVFVGGDDDHSVVIMISNN